MFIRFRNLVVVLIILMSILGAGVLNVRPVLAIPNAINKTFSLDDHYNADETLDLDGSIPASFDLQSSKAEINEDRKPRFPAPALKNDSLSKMFLNNKRALLLDSANVSFQEVIGGLVNPVFITHAGDGSGRIFIVERKGRIRILKNGALLATPFLDIQSIVKSDSSEQGLLGLAFHPNYDANGKFYVVYTAPRSGDSVGSILTLRQYAVSAGNPDIADPNSDITILTIDHPTYSNHNGGTVAFGNDGYLYWSTGDGGGGGDPFNNAQDLTKLLGKVLRIDVNSGSPYAIPASNPFYNSSVPGIKKEIWAYGLRNPWRMSFDRIIHDLYIGDVGQSKLEEIDFQSSASTGGENYGWRVMEGSSCYNPSSGCDQSGKILPIAEYNHTLGCSVTGGYVYRGSNFPSLSGYYLYGDFCSGRIFGIYNDYPTGWTMPVQLADTPFNIATFGEDEQGELYLADYGGGKIYQIQYQDPNYKISGNVENAGDLELQRWRCEDSRFGVGWELLVRCATGLERDSPPDASLLHL